MSSNDSGEKTEEATPQRREDFRKRGQVAQSKELSSALTLLAVVLLMWLMGGYFMQDMASFVKKILLNDVIVTAKQGDIFASTKSSMSLIFKLIAPSFVIVFIVGFISTVSQIGFLYNEEALQVKWDRIDPLSGLKKMFSLRNGFEGFKSILKLLVVAGIGYFIIRAELHYIPKSTSFNTEQLFSIMGRITLKLFLSIALLLIALASFDYLFQKYDLEQKMKMSKQEIKEEMKSREGDPLIKSRIRRIQREMAQKRMMNEVPKADVIVTNPTHIAVALKYSKEMMAPTVVAMGADLIANKIKELAKEHNVPVVENKPLARTIFKTMKIGQIIPRELYNAVAEVLSYVYQLKRKKVV